MPFVVGADPDRLEAAARQFNEVSTRLETTSRQLASLLTQARANQSPAEAYAVLATHLSPLLGHVAEAKSAVRQLNERALQQREKSGGQQRDSTGSGSSSSSSGPTFSPEVRRLLERAEADQAWLERKAEDLRAAGDGNFWFAKTYAHVTAEVVKSVKAGKYADPQAVLMEEIGFTEVYRQNLEYWESGSTNLMYPNWAVAFSRINELNDAARQGYEWSPLRGEGRASMIIPAALAHIKWDLPNVIADVARQRYGDNMTDRNIETMRSDFFKMADIFPKAQKAMIAEIQNGTASYDFGRSETLRDLGKNMFLPTDEVRWEAFRTAEALMLMHRDGIHDDPVRMEKYLYGQNALPARISGQVIQRYPWH